MACLIRAWCHCRTVVPYCRATNPSSQLHSDPPPHTHIPSSHTSPSSFLSTPLPVALQISGGRHCQTFQLFKQVSGRCREPAGVDLPLWCPTSLACANPPLNPLSPRKPPGPNCTGPRAQRSKITCSFFPRFHIGVLLGFKKVQRCVTSG